MNVGVLYAIGAYLLWGLLPIFWKSISHIPASEILSHRMVWSLGFAVILLIYRKQWHWLRPAIRDFKTLLTFLATSSLLAINWFTYIWAVNSGYIVEASLGYFMNPLLNVLLGVIFLKEKLRFWQGGALILAAAGVLYMTLIYGSFPWIAMILAFTFGFYGFLRKTAPLESLEGLSMEMLYLFLPALLYLLHLNSLGTGSFGNTNITTNILLSFTGIATALPLLWFAYGARKVTLTTLGFLQYIAPTLQFLLGVFVYHEHMNKTRMFAFIAIWIALFIYTFEAYYSRKTRKMKIS